jgi:hypothetical protein
MPMKRACYPKDWKSLRAQVLSRAGERCECTGECGAAAHDGQRCEVPDGVLIQRRKGELTRWVRAFSVGETSTHSKPFRVVITTAHLCQDSMCRDLEHLRALCQLCHLRLDAEQHRKSRARTLSQRSGSGVAR